MENEMETGIIPGESGILCGADPFGQSLALHRRVSRAPWFGKLHKQNYGIGPWGVQVGCL